MREGEKKGRRGAQGGREGRKGGGKKGGREGGREEEREGWTENLLVCLCIGVAVPAYPHGSVIAVHLLQVRGAAAAHHPATAPAVMPPVELDQEGKRKEREEEEEETGLIIAHVTPCAYEMFAAGLFSLIPFSPPFLPPTPSLPAPPSLPTLPLSLPLFPSPSLSSFTFLTSLSALSSLSSILPPLFPPLSPSLHSTPLFPSLSPSLHSTPSLPSPPPHHSKVHIVADPAASCPSVRLPLLLRRRQKWRLILADGVTIVQGGGAYLRG